MEYRIFRGVVRKPGDEIAFQCKCGRLATLPANASREDTLTTKDTDGRLLCTSCGEYGIDYSVRLALSPMVTSGLHELKKIFRQALSENYMTLCYYFYSSLQSFNPRFNEVYFLCDQIFDMHCRNTLFAALDEDGILRLQLKRENVELQEMILMLLMINHVTEIAELYEILFTIAKIAKGEHFLIGDDGRSIHGVGYQLRAPEGTPDRLKYRIVTVRREVHRMHLFKLSKLLRCAFNHELRNAFSHSEYRLSDKGVYLSRYRRLITPQQFTDTFFAAFYVQKTLFDFMEKERQRFIETGGYSESGWKIEPLVSEHGFAIKISSSGPTSATGRGADRTQREAAKNN